MTVHCFTVKPFDKVDENLTITFTGILLKYADNDRLASHS